MPPWTINSTQKKNKKNKKKYMDADELEMELENKLATKDVAPVETPDEAEPPVSVEDFVSHSG